MKTVELYTKMISPRKDQTAMPIEAKSINWYKFALEGCEKNVKGIKRIMKVGRVIDKLDQAEEKSINQIELENEEFEILKESVESVQFPPIILYFRELFSALDEK